VALFPVQTSFLSQAESRLSRHLVPRDLNYTVDNITNMALAVIVRQLLRCFHYDSSPGTTYECETAPNGGRPSDQANRFGRWAHL